MKRKIPVRSLANVNLLLAVIFSGFVGIFLFTYANTNGETIFSVIQSAISILVVGFLHIWVRIQLSRYENLSFIKKQLYQFTISYVVTMLFLFSTGSVREIFADKTWKIITPAQQLTTTIVASLGINLLILFMHNFVITYQAKLFAEIDNARLRLANVEANNSLLKQQIHPHFLFNALSVIKSLYKADTKTGDEYMIHLANFLRAAISNNTAKIVSLNDEIELCDDYVSMQKIRFGDALQYTMNIKESSQDCIPFFSLQPLLENAMKHNDATDEHPLVIKVYKDNDYIVVENNVQRKKRPVASTGNGLINLIKRYQLLIGDEPIIQQDNVLFSVRLKILKA